MTELAPTVVRQLDIADCWEWTGYLNRTGYGFATVARRQWLVHRYVYTTLVGPIPDGLHLDHLCRNHKCANPDHLEPVTIQENVRRGQQGQWQKRKTHCPRGHSYSGDNLGIAANGSRRCKACLRMHNRKYRERDRAA